MLYGFNVFSWADRTSNSRTGFFRVTMRLYTNKCDDSPRFAIASFTRNVDVMFGCHYYYYCIVLLIYMVPVYVTVISVFLDGSTLVSAPCLPFVGAS